MARVLILGATGYVGAAVARALKAAGHDVHGLARSAANLVSLRAAGVAPVQADADDLDALAKAALGFDAVIMAAKLQFGAEAEMMRALIAAYRGSERTLIFTSGTGVVSAPARDGAWDDHVFAEDDPFPFPALGVRRNRLPTEEMVRSAAADGLRTMVIRAPMVWGLGGSDHVPQFFDCARRFGEVAYVGLGLNVCSNVHVDDLAELFGLVLERGTPRALYHAVAGEVNFRTIAEAVGEVAGCPARSRTYAELSEMMGRDWVNMGLAMNSRTRAARSRAELGWRPRRLDLIDDIRNGSYREAWARSLAGA